MYLSYFNLQEYPFTITPDPRFFYLAPNHAESVAKCEYAIRNKSGLAVVYGDVGTGKTTIVNEIMRRFKDGQFTIAVLDNPNQTSDTALLKAIAGEFGLKPYRAKQAAFDQLQEFLAHEVFEGRTPLLLIDEAQDLRNSTRADRDMLGMIKTLTNLKVNIEEDHPTKLLQIILFGQLELIPLLEAKRELKSRVAQFGVLSPLTKDDAIAMMEHRWRTAGGTLPLPFEVEALELIYQAAKGLPRDIITASDTALIHAFANKLKKVSVEGAEYAIKAHRLVPV